LNDDRSNNDTVNSINLNRSILGLSII